MSPSLLLCLLALPAGGDPSETLALPEPVAGSSTWAGSEAELERVAAAAEQAAEAGDPLALSRLLLMTNLGELLDRRGRSLAGLQRIRQAKKVDPLTRAQATFLAAAKTEELGQLESAREIRQSLGLAERYWVIGPFDNSAGGGHRAPFAPELGLDLDAEVVGKDRRLKWRSAGDAAVLGTLPISSLMYPAKDSTAYALVAIESAVEQAAAVRTGSTDALRLYLNGQEIYSSEADRRAALDQDAAPVWLPKGTSTLLVKCSWIGRSARLYLRVTAPDGSPLPGVRLLGEEAELRRAISEAKARRPAAPRKLTVSQVDAPIDRAIEAAEKSPPRPVAGAPDRLAELYALRSNLKAVLSLYDRRKLPTPPVLDLLRSIRRAPGEPWAWTLYAFRVAGTDKRRATAALEAALVVDPSFVPALEKLGSLALQSERPVAAKTALSRALAKDPSYDPARISLASALLAEPLGAYEARALLAERPAASDAAAGAGPALEGTLARVVFDLGDRQRGAALGERALRRLFKNRSLRGLLIKAALDRADPGAALALVEDAIKLEPGRLAHRLARARILSASGDEAGLKAALEILRADAQTFVDAPAIPRLAAELSLRRGDVPQAIAALDRVAQLSPEDREARRHRASLMGERGELEDEYSVDPLSYLGQAPSAAERAWGASVLFERTAVRLYENGTSSRFVQRVARLGKASLGDQLRREQIPFSPSRENVEILSAEQIHPDGEILKASRISEDGPRGKVGGQYVDARSKLIEFDDLRPGDLVNLRYRVDSVGPNIFGGFFGEMNMIEGQLPKERVEVIALAPADRPLFPGLIRAPAPELSIEGGVSKMVWRKSDVPALEPEPLSPPYTELGTTVSVSTYQSWDELAAWYAQLFKDQLELDDDSRQAGRRAIAGATTEAEKIRRLYNYVVKSTRYVGIELGIHGWKPYKASEVHRRRYGDCKDKATLLAALLRDNGIEATVALVRTFDHGGFPAGHASMWAFNHAITYVPSAELYLDGTAEYSGSGELPYMDQGAFVLIVWPDGRFRLDSPPEATAAENMNRSNYQAEITAEGDLLLDGEEKFFGARAASVRQEYEEPKTRKQELERALSMISPGAEVLGQGFSDLSDLEATPSYRYQSALPRYAAINGSSMIVPLTLFPHQVTTAYGALAERKTDLVTTYAWSTRNVIHYKIPPGWRIESLPEGQRVETPYATLSQTVTKTEDGFTTDDTVTLLTRRVPRADYPAFREALGAIDRALERKVVLSR